MAKAVARKRATAPARKRRQDEAGNHGFVVGIGRAFAGAMLFALPILMTMEMWQLGFYMESPRLALLLLLTFALLVRMSRYGGLRHTESVWDDVADALVAMAVAAVATTLVLLLFNVLDRGMSFDELVGTVAVQTVAASIGAMLARNQLHSDRVEEDRDSVDKSYAGEIFLMILGALFLSLNIAPTEEVMLISFQSSPWHKIAILLATLATMHILVYTLEFGGTEQRHADETFWSVFLRFTVVGYVCVMGVGLFLLWSFGNLAGLSMQAALGAVIVLAVPGAIGAAVARLVL